MQAMRDEAQMDFDIAIISEHMRVAPSTSTRLLTVMLILSTNWSILENPITNRRFENCTDFELPTELIEAAGLGSEFSPDDFTTHPRWLRQLLAPFYTKSSTAKVHTEHNTYNMRPTPTPK